ncbi:MAG: N-acetyltransferase GCN5 [Parcubacteria group bacterium Gr01-1014_8]|nr:MAG: N-acetyltransferase GCN5 [Parcubacteria group bacterium Gr01-1014_8]
MEHHQTIGEMRYRRATMGDSAQLFIWRNDPVTRENSRNGKLLEFTEHTQWLETALQNSDRQIYIAEFENEQIGVVRTDRIGDVLELSWTVVPECRGKGLGKKMVVGFVMEVLGSPSKLRASIRKGNIASEKIALALGLRSVREESGADGPPMVVWETRI